MRKIIELIILFPFICNSQNLVPNSGFESYIKCPGGHSQYGMPMYMSDWFSPSTGTPDYFNECGLSNAKARINWAGRCEDFSGNGYVGIMTYLDKKAYCEYLSVALQEPLDSGITYAIRFSYRLSSYSRVSTGNLSLAFTDFRPALDHDKKLDFRPAITAMPDSAIVKGTGSWQTMYGDYVANGFERFLTIGNFSERNEIYRIKSGGNHEPMLASASYYYIDDVVVEPQIKLIPLEDIVFEDESPFEMDSLVVLKNVQFAYNRSEINPSSEAELSRLHRFMINNPDVRIEIYGYTDDQGSDEYNLELSLRRAKAVMNYLIEQGIDTERLKHFGFGKSRPLVNSMDEFARSINRRVEIKLQR